MDAANARKPPQRIAAMALTDLYFMLNPPWCMGSRLDISTLTQVPEKVKSRSYIIESFRNAEPGHHLASLSGRLRAGSQRCSRKFLRQCRLNAKRKKRKRQRGAEEKEM